MKKINALAAVSLARLALMGCGSGSDTGSEVTAEPTDGTSDMMGGDNNQDVENLGTAEGQDIDEVDVKTNPNMEFSEEKMTGADEIEEQRPDQE
mgnify:FL=1